MKKQVVSREDFLSQTGISQKTLLEWEQAKLIVPAGFSEEHLPFYTTETIERACQIKKLCAVGFGLAAIQKIIRKIGLPDSEPTADRKPGPGQYLTVGTLAERVGVSSRTLKHWEDKGIIEPDMRSEGGFRFYSDVFVYLCTLIKDLQLFGYSLEEIKHISDRFQDFLALQKNLEGFSRPDAAAKLEGMQGEITLFFTKMKLFKEGVARWEDLLKDKQKEIRALSKQNEKRPVSGREGNHA